MRERGRRLARFFSNQGYDAVGASFVFFAFRPRFRHTPHHSPPHFHVAPRSSPRACQARPTKVTNEDHPCSLCFLLSGAAFCCRFFGNVDFEGNPYIAIENDGGSVR